MTITSEIQAPGDSSSTEFILDLSYHKRHPTSAHTYLEAGYNVTSLGVIS